LDENLTGMTFGYLKVIELRNKDKRGTSWVCECVCGNKIILGTSRLIGSPKRSPEKSCGCTQNKQAGQVVVEPIIYKAWKDMIDRCYDSKRANYERFGGKGIQVCGDWKEDFLAFLEWSKKNGYASDLYFSRIDKTKDYTPENCRWTDKYLQIETRGMLKSNTSGTTGVSYSEKRGSYRAYITRKGVRKYLGSFATLKNAIEAREKAEELYKLHGKLE
jgi:hypothetical protein